jgi:hypothetical protein
MGIGLTTNRVGLDIFVALVIGHAVAQSQF